MADIAALTSEEKRNVRDYNPSLSDRPPGIDLPVKLDATITQSNTASASATTNLAALGKIYSGTAMIPSDAGGDTSGWITVAAGVDLQAKPVVATKGKLVGAPAASYIDTVTHGNGAGAGDLGQINIVVSASTGHADKTIQIHWIVDARIGIA